MFTLNGEILYLLLINGFFRRESCKKNVNCYWNKYTRCQLIAYKVRAKYKDLFLCIYKVTCFFSFDTHKD